MNGTYGTGKDGAAARAVPLLSLACAAAVAAASCATAVVSPREGELAVRVRTGSAWMHDFSAWQRNPPQFVLWAERADGSFGGTVFATRKAATEGWIFNGGNRRAEALPVWGRRRGVRAADGVYLPTKEEPLPDAVCGATPKGDFLVALKPEADEATGAELRTFWLYAEVNHSTDYNGSYPEGAKRGEAGYSGGDGGSGQPSVVYRAWIDLDAAPARFVFQPIGHGSPDGSDGDVAEDLSSLTSALRIVDGIDAELVR